MKKPIIFYGRARSPSAPRLILIAIVKLLMAACLSVNSASAQIQQAWVARYNNGIANGNHQAYKMAFDTAGNVCVMGSSENTSSNLGYVLIKYAPNGNQLWAARFDSTNYPSATPSNFVVDISNNVIVTGNALTIKYDSNGNQLWTAPHAGAALAVDNNADVYVTGCGTQFNTVKLSPTGGSLWQTSYADVGPTLAQAITVDTSNNIYVSGSDQWQQGFDDNYVRLLNIKYNSDGSQLWKTNGTGNEEAVERLDVVGSVLDKSNNLYIEMSYPPNDPVYDEYSVYKYTSNGALLWNTELVNNNGNSQSAGIAIDSADNILITGVFFTYTGPPWNSTDYYNYGTFKLGSNGAQLWEVLYPQLASAPSGASAIAVDCSNNVYVTGYSPGATSGNDIVTIKYDPNGNQQWLQRYNGPGNGNDAGNAIVADNAGNVYVTGYDTPPGGGTEIVTIKYSPLILQHNPDGTVLLQAQGAVGETFQVEASCDCKTWTNIGQGTADTNGLFQFEDTNAPQYPYRIYYTIPQ